MKKLVLVTAAVVLGYASAGFAQDKPAAVKKAVADACGGKVVATSDIPRIVKQLYVGCSGEADIDGCKVKCLQ